MAEDNPPITVHTRQSPNHCSHMTIPQPLLTDDNPSATLDRWQSLSHSSHMTIPQPLLTHDNPSATLSLFFTFFIISLFQVFPLLIEKDDRAGQNISLKFPCACPTVISSIFGKSFHFPFPYFVEFSYKFIFLISIHVFPYRIFLLSFSVFSCPELFKNKLTNRESVDNLRALGYQGKSVFSSLT